jgi:hypothetical protein
MQSNGSTSFSRRVGKTQRQSSESRPVCQSRKSRQARQNDEPEPKKLQTNPVEDDDFSSSSSSEEENHFGPDKTSKKYQGKSKKRFAKPSKQSAVVDDYVSPSEMNKMDFGDDDICKHNDNNGLVPNPFLEESEEDTRDEIPHHLLWDHHAGVFPAYCEVLYLCTCWGCEYGRKKYKN